ncbi:MAG: HAMP domain-containing histidine kinase [Syntrophaceae bacterium]|nr:HAMP domain-containing histidine kinase [Syntrophaceae bacterium]
MSLREMIDRKKIYIIIIVASALFITYLHHWMFQEDPRRIVLNELYYIPLLLGAMMFGLKGAILTYLLVSALYLPYLSEYWTVNVLGLMARLLHLLLSGAFAFLAGFLVDREKRRQKQFEKDRYLAGLGRVATTIVHDLRNPLIAILFFARRIQEGTGDLNMAVQTIINSGQKMERIVHDVLDFAKPIRLELKEESIEGVINRAYDSCKAKAEKENVVLTVNLSGTSLTILIDGFQMERALVNLISNAIDATAKGEEVAIQTFSAKNYLVVSIKDSGSGMDRETLENIFTPFYSRKNDGFGLGMPIAKKIIEGHKGNIWIDSQPGIGTEVTIRLPYKTN